MADCIQRQPRVARATYSTSATQPFCDRSVRVILPAPGISLLHLMLTNELALEPAQAGPNRYARLTP